MDWLAHIAGIITGIIATAFGIALIGIVDVFILKSPHLNMGKLGKVKFYIYATSWELSFFILGFIVAVRVVN